jgi:hypothetical protein
MNGTEYVGLSPEGDRTERVDNASKTKGEAQKTKTEKVRRVETFPMGSPDPFNQSSYAMSLNLLFHPKSAGKSVDYNVSALKKNGTVVSPVHLTKVMRDFHADKMSSVRSISKDSFVLIDKSVKKLWMWLKHLSDALKVASKDV